jgi:acetolactate synthase-1/2/3 large subunit
MQKYSDVVAEWLVRLGYTHCFFVAGGNIMHLLEAARNRFTCVPFVHEVAAGIAVEAFNESASTPGPRAFALVTAGPGLTNIVTAIAGAFLESRELLVLGGQVKSTDLARGEIRQRGIQEIDGVSIVAPICVAAQRLEAPIGFGEFAAFVERGRTPRMGPVFLEICLDAQGAPVDRAELERQIDASNADVETRVARVSAEAEDIVARTRAASRPVFLIGGGIARATARDLEPALAAAGVAVMTTWNGLDRVDARTQNYFGRPNQWGMRHANVLLQQADLVVAFGTRLGMQQTGFNWQGFVPLGQVVQIDIDPAELLKGHPKVDIPICGDANEILRAVLAADLGAHSEWLQFAASVRAALPTEDPENVTATGFIDPYHFARRLSAACTAADIVMPCSSGGAYTTMMQAFEQRSGQIVVTDHALASMGYGLSAAIGAALAHPSRRTILVEGDGGFTQNLQELATVAVNNLNLKMFVFSNEGYASIRMTQRNYFGGDYLGCDTKTGLGFPDWIKLFEAYGIPSHQLESATFDDPSFVELLDLPGPAAFVVPIDPEQTYYPKISSRVTASGSMESAPLHLMTPELSDAIADAVLRYTAGVSPRA